MKSTDKGFRSRRWTDDPGPRYWWHRLLRRMNAPLGLFTLDINPELA